MPSLFPFRPNAYTRTVTNVVGKGLSKKTNARISGRTTPKARDIAGTAADVAQYEIDQDSPPAPQLTPFQQYLLRNYALQYQANLRPKTAAYEQGLKDAYTQLKIAYVPSWDELKASVYTSLPPSVRDLIGDINSPQFNWLWRRRRPTLLNLVAGESGDILRKATDQANERTEMYARGGVEGHMPKRPKVTGESNPAPMPVKKG